MSPSMALDSGIPAGMTVFSRFVGLVYNDRSYSLGTRSGMIRLPMDDKLELED